MVSGAVDGGDRGRPRPPPDVHRQLAGFVLFSHGLTWALWSVVLLRGGPVWEMPNAALFLLGGAGVPLGGIVMTARTSGRRGLADLLRRTVDLQRPPHGEWVVVLLLFPLATLCGAALAGLLEGGTGPLLHGPVGRWAGPLDAIAAIGVLWAVWHLPLYFLDGYYAAFALSVVWIEGEELGRERRMVPAE